MKDNLKIDEGVGIAVSAAEGDGIAIRSEGWGLGRHSREGWDG